MHNITIQSTHSTVAGLLEKTNVHHAGHLNKTHTNKKEITYEHKTTKKERKDSEITQYEITHIPVYQYRCIKYNEFIPGVSE